MDDEPRISRKLVSGLSRLDVSVGKTVDRAKVVGLRGSRGLIAVGRFVMTWPWLIVGVLGLVLCVTGLILSAIH